MFGYSSVISSNSSVQMFWSYSKSQTFCWYMDCNANLMHKFYSSFEFSDSFTVIFKILNVSIQRKLGHSALSTSDICWSFVNFGKEQRNVGILFIFQSLTMISLISLQSVQNFKMTKSVWCELASCWLWTESFCGQTKLL